MKKRLNLVLPLIIILFSIIFLLCTITPIHALDITISWNANTEDDLAGYRIYYKTDSTGEPYEGIGAEEGNSPIDLPVEFIDANSPTSTLTNLSDTQVYYFVVTAYDTSNLESDYSNEVTTVIIDTTASSVAITYTEFWVVYDRSKEVEMGLFPYDQNINIKIDAKDRRQNRMEQVNFDFKTETEDEHYDAQANLPDTGELASDDSAITGLYDEDIQAIRGDLYGAKIVYNSAEVVTPTFGSINEFPPFIISNEISDEAIGAPVVLQPPTVFSTPVKIFIPCPGQTDLSELGVYLSELSKTLLFTHFKSQIN